MEIALIILAVVVLCVGFLFVGAVLNDRKYQKYEDVVLRYHRLTPRSKEMVDGYIKARSVNDDRTTYKRV